MWSARVSARSSHLTGLFAVAATLGVGLTLASAPRVSAGTPAPPPVTVAALAPMVQTTDASARSGELTSPLRSHKPRRLVISDRPLTGALGMTPPFAAPGEDPATAAARLAVEEALARQARARKKAAEKDPLPTVMPIRGAGYESGFGARSKLWAVAHSGLDFSASTGTEAIAVVSGTIRAIFLHPAYGNVVQLVRDDGVEFWYCHLSSTLVEPGERVRQGQAIALTGATGNVTGPHLHFEVRVAGVPTDPGDFLYRTPGIAGTPPAWAYAYSDTPPPGKTIIGYPPDKKDREKKEREKNRDEKGQDEKDNRKPTPSASPSAPTTTPPADKPSPEPSFSPSPSTSPSSSPSAQPSPSPSGSGN